MITLGQLDELRRRLKAASLGITVRFQGSPLGPELNVSAHQDHGAVLDALVVLGVDFPAGRVATIEHGADHGTVVGQANLLPGAPPWRGTVHMFGLPGTTDSPRRVAV